MNIGDRVKYENKFGYINRVAISGLNVWYWIYFDNGQRFIVPENELTPCQLSLFN